MADERIPASEPAHAEVHHEQSDVNVGAILWAAVILVVFAILVHIGVYVHFGLLRKGERDPNLLPVSMVKQKGPVLPPAPRLQPFPTPGASGKAASPLGGVPPRDLAAMRRDQAKFLSSYGWTNEATRTAHIPIDRAIDLQLQKGFPVAAPGAQAQQPAVRLPDMAQPAAGNGLAQPVPAGTPQPPPEPQAP